MPRIDAEMDERKTFEQAVEVVGKLPESMKEPQMEPET